MFDAYPPSKVLICRIMRSADVQFHNETERHVIIMIEINQENMQRFPLNHSLEV